MSILASSTIQIYERTWDSSFTDIGFNNCLFIVPGTAKRRYSIPQTIPESEKQIQKENIVKILKHANEHRVLSLTPDAKELYDAWYMNLENSIHAKRLETYTTKFMSLLAVNQLRTEVDVDIIEDVIALSNWQLEMRKIHDPIDADNNIAKMEEKIRRVLSRGPESERNLKQKTNANLAGIWFFETAKGNLQKANEVFWNKKYRAWEYVD